MENDKYIVFKASDVSLSQVPIGLMLEDAIVIRKQDIFAGPGLFAYAAAITTGIEMIDAFSGGPDMWDIEPEMESKLQELRDFFFEQAQEASEWPKRKIPD